MEVNEMNTNKITKKTIWVNPDGTYWQKEEQVTNPYNEKGYLYRAKSEYLRVFLDMPYPDTLGWEEKGRLGRIEYEVSNDQLIVYKSGNKIKPHTVKTLSKILKCSERTVSNMIKKCKEIGIIKQAKIDGVKYFVFSPVYKLKGNRLSLTAFMVFQEELEKTLPEAIVDRYLEDMNVHRPEIEIEE